MLHFVRSFYSLIAPGQARAIRHNVDLGLELGRRAELVIAQPLESLFGEPLAQVRNKLRIPDPARSGVLASRPSFVADLLYGRSKPAA